MIRLRQSLASALRHPLLGPLVVLLLAVILAFLALHTIEDGVEGLLFSCALALVLALRLLVPVGGTPRVRTGRSWLCGRAPPACLLRLLPSTGLGRVLSTVPLRL